MKMKSKLYFQEPESGYFRHLNTTGQQEKKKSQWDDS